MSKPNTHPLDAEVARLAHVDDATVAALTTAATRDQVYREITADQAGPVFALQRPRWRRWRVALPGAAALAVFGVVALSIAGPMQVGPVRVGPQPASAAISIEREGGYYIARVEDPVADPKRFRAAFAEHGLDIDLKLVPASPKAVGTLVYFDGGDAIKAITAKGECVTGGGGDACPVGLKIPVDFAGHASVVFGRAARPGEKFATTAEERSEGGMLHCVNVYNDRVDRATAELRQHDLAVAEFRVIENVRTVRPGVETGRSVRREPGEVPGGWYVHEVMPWAAGEVLLFAGPQPKEHPNPHPDAGCSGSS